MTSSILGLRQSKLLDAKLEEKTEDVSCSMRHMLLKSAKAQRKATKSAGRL